MPKHLHSVEVALGGAVADRGYSIVIGEDLLSDPTLFDARLGDRPVVIVTNETVAGHYLPGLRSALGKARQITEVILPDGEAHKHLGTLETIITAALEHRHERRSVFLALGGGVVGDMTGFAAATFMRGAEFIQLPTTLLAQVDSSVGGKTGVNHPLGKNMIGAFHQPELVVIDINTLASLPAREFAAGMAEVVKYGLIYDQDFFSWLLENRLALADREPAHIAEAIERSCMIKAAVVAADEREGGIRAILNFGHTFGHAIELVQGYGAWLHGEAVAAGMVIAAKISARRGMIAIETVDELVNFLSIFGLPVCPPADMTAAVFEKAMQHDKKVERGRTRFILLASLGEATIVDDVITTEIEAAIAAN